MTAPEQPSFHHGTESQWWRYHDKMVAYYLQQAPTSGGQARFYHQCAREHMRNRREYPFPSDES